jgi:hypothetical protein
MGINEIKSQLILLKQKHDAVGDELDDLSFAEIYEEEAEDLIVAYCVGKSYLINGFPTEMMESEDEEYDDDYFCRERYRLYLDLLLVEKDDVAELMWFYNDLFWPGTFSDKQALVNHVNAYLKSGRMYDVEI